MSDMSSLGKLEDGIIDLSNRSHRNTLIFPNIPEGSKGVDVERADVVKDFYQNYTGFEVDGPGKVVMIKRSHRQPMGPPQKDRNKILHKSKTMKSKPFKWKINLSHR